jgi:arginine repressor
MVTGRADGTPFWKDHMFRSILQDTDIRTDEKRAAALSAYGFNAFKSAVNRYLDKETYKRAVERGNYIIYGK